MNFLDYQKQAAKTAIYPNKGTNLYYPALGLAGEAGEVANKVKKVMRDYNGLITPKMERAIKKEIGGVLWYCAALASEMGLHLDQVAVENIAELASRKKRGVLAGSGDNR